MNDFGRVREDHDSARHLPGDRRWDCQVCMAMERIEVKMERLREGWGQVTELQRETRRLDERLARVEKSLPRWLR